MDFERPARRPLTPESRHYSAMQQMSAKCQKLPCGEFAVKDCFLIRKRTSLNCQRLSRMGPEAAVLSSSSAETSINTVHGFIICTNKWEEPGLAGIGRSGWEIQSIECTWLFTACDVKGRAIPQIGHHSDATAIATGAVMNAISLTDVRYVIKGNGDQAGP